MNNSLTWAGIQKQKRAEDRKELAESIAFMVLIVVGLYFSLFA